MIKYILLCLISILSGKGALKLAKIPITFSQSIFLAPIITLACWTIYYGWGILLDFPGKNLWITGYVFTLVLALIGIFTIITEHNKKHLIRNVVILFFALCLPIITMASYFKMALINYGGANAPDGWSYIAFGQYLWENIRGAEGQLAPLHQYAAHLAHGRFMASALLGFLSPIAVIPGDTEGSANLFIAWTLFNFACAAAFFALTEKLSTKLIICYLVLLMYSGWIMGLLSVNNFDNALILSLLPAFAGIANLENIHKTKWLLVLAMLVATTNYSYIELAPLILSGAALLFLQPVTRSVLKNKKISLIPIVIIIVFIIILILPYIKESILYFNNQLHTAMQQVGTRPGEGFFPTLYDHQIIGFWGFTKNNISTISCGIILTGLTFLGLFKLWQERKFGIITLTILLLTAYADMIFKWHYSYGAYKIILIGWWLYTFCVIEGLEKILLSRSKYKIILLIAITISGIIYFSITHTLQRYYANNVRIEDIRPFRKLTELNIFTNGKAIQVNVDDYLFNEWAVYYLRDTPIIITQYRMYMAQGHVIPYMQRAKFVDPKNVGYILTDNQAQLPNKKMIWKSGPYSLWKIQN